MSLIQIHSTPETKQQSSALFRLGFRPFFLAGGIFAVVAVLVWTFVYSFQIPITTSPISLFEWHAHQMIYGFSMAIIAGFLLTAIMNWTSVETISGTALKCLVACWAIPRVLLLFGMSFIELAAFFDLLFFLGLSYAVTEPIIRVQQWRQIGILSKIALLAVGNLCFYLDAFQIYADGAFVGIYGGLFLIISLILTIGGRVMPAFIRNALDHPVELSNPFWIALASFIIFLIFTVNFLFIHDTTTTGIASTLLFVLTTYRLYCWHVPALWSKPLLWGLFSSYLFIDLGFLFYALYAFASVSPFVAAHAFAYGGVGLATLAMMSRVAIGHTGRSIRTPPRGTGAILMVLLSGALIRVIGPLITAEHYRYLIITSQALWMIAFVGFLVLFTGMLLSPRVDGRPG